MNHAQTINTRTRCLAVLGNPVFHSASPVMQNAAIVAHKLNWRYFAFDVRPLGLGAALAGAKVMGFVGLNLTVPHKIAALQHIDVLDKSAELVQAVNTIRFEAHRGDDRFEPIDKIDPDDVHEVRSVGFSTDGEGLIRALRSAFSFDVQGKTVFVLGAGGAARLFAENGLYFLKIFFNT